jgi:hypothetical protein
MRRALTLIAVGLAMAVAPGDASASVLCRTRTKTLIVRDACKRREQPVTLDQQVEAGVQGPQGRAGQSGPNFRDLKVLDSNGHEVGVVTSLQTYYGAATVAGALTVPGSAGPEFYTFTVDGRGLQGQIASCKDPQVQYFRTSDCTGGAFANCEYGACSSTSSGLLARPLFTQDAATGCYAGDASEFERGDFYQRFVARGVTAADVAAVCAARRGTLLEPAMPCVPPRRLYCAPCCRLVQDVGVAPMHTIDAGVVGTPPFRFSR